MKFCLYAAVCAVAIAFAPGLAQTAPGHPPVEAFGALPTVRDPALTPDGKHLALIQVHQGHPVAVIWDLDSPRQPQLTIPFEKGFIEHVVWANNTRLLVTLNMNGRHESIDVNPWHRTVALDYDGKNAVVMFSNKRDSRDINLSGSAITDLAPDDPDHVYMPFWAAEDNVGQPRRLLYKVDVNTGIAIHVMEGTNDTIQWITDGNGNVVARLDGQERPLTEHIFAYTSGNAAKEIAVTDASNGYGYDLFGLTPDGQSLAFIAKSETWGTESLAAISLATGKVSELYAVPVYDVADALKDPWTGRVIGAEVVTHLAHDTYFDPALQQLQTLLEQPFPGMSVHAVSWSRDRSRVVFVVDGPNAPAAYYLADLKTQEFQLLARAYPALKPSDLGDVRIYDYKARDGLDIPAYLTVPPGKNAKNLPVVILPHGGPRARDDMSFDWMSQFFANRGYAVLRPNFRGSSGYGRNFREAGYREWGRKMQDDITDGVRKLIADGVADPKRICIVGASYGGYAAVAGATFTPDLYACAAAWAPVTDLRPMYASLKRLLGSDSWEFSTWARYIGDDPDTLDAVSPAQNAAKVKCPILILHGEDDTTVRIEQSERMESALRSAGKNVTFIRLPKETHYMETSDTRIRWLTELEKFLKENIGN